MTLNYYVIPIKLRFILIYYGFPSTERKEEENTRADLFCFDFYSIVLYTITLHTTQYTNALNTR